MFCKMEFSKSIRNRMTGTYSWDVSVFIENGVNYILCQTYSRLKDAEHHKKLLELDGNENVVIVKENGYFSFYAAQFNKGLEVLL